MNSSLTTRDLYFRVRNLYKFLLKNKALHEIVPTNIFSDEPPYYCYSTLLHKKQTVCKKPEYIFTPYELSGTGLSFRSPEIALLKCLMESVERFCLSCFEPNKLIEASVEDLKKSKRRHINLSFYNTQGISQQTKLKWIEGINLTKKITCLIPAQLVYLNIRDYYKEPNIFVSISTGAAAGFDRNFSLLRAIYEVVERDTLMSTYLLQIPRNKIQLSSLRSAKINRLHSLLTKYNLDWHLFDMTNDISILTYLSIVSDQTEAGMPLAFGGKTGYLSIDDIVTGSLEEAIMTRPAGRVQRSMSMHNIRVNRIKTRLDRLIYWLNNDRVKDVSYLLKTSYQRQKENSIKNVQDNELQFVINQLDHKGFDVFAVDITVGRFKDLGIHVHKSIIPGLQPLYLNEKEKWIVSDRLDAVAKYFDIKRPSKTITTFHPFL